MNKVLLSCGHAATPTDCTPGYAVTQDGRKICYACADEAQREDLKDRTRPFVGYLSGDGRGNPGIAISLRPCKG